MKIKLLKKIRKRFSITHHPKGVMLSGEHINYNMFMLKDNTNSWWSKWAYSGDNGLTEIDCVNHLKSDIIHKLREEGHESRKDKEIINSYEKIWWCR